MRKILPKVLIFSFLLFIFHFSFFISPAFAQGKTSPPPSPNVETNVPDTLHNWTQTVMIEVMSSLSCQLTGIDPTNPNQVCLGIDQKTGKIGFYPPSAENGTIGGAIGVVGNGITMLFNSPIHTADYLQNLAQNFGISKKSYAQQSSNGTGFEGLKPLLGLWVGFRNIVYLVFVIVFVAIGLAIMLRIKIDPRTVMSIQNQIPKIIIGILLVTFSYAIGGFLIDMMYVSTYVIGNLIISADPTLSKELPAKLLTDPNPFIAAGHVGNNLGDNGGTALNGLWNLIFSPAKGVGQIIGSITTTLIGVNSLPIIDGIGGMIARALFGGIGGTIAFIIITIALLIALFRLWFALIFAYITILLNVVLGPFWIIGGLFPGSPINISGWIRSLIANLAAFPAVIAMFLLGKVFMDAFGTGDSATHFVPPLIGDRGSLKGIGAIIGLGIILMTPNVINMLKAALKAPKTDTGIGKSISGATGVVTGIGKSTIGATSTAIMGDPFNPTQKGFGAIFRGWQRRNG